MRIRVWVLISALVVVVAGAAFAAGSRFTDVTDSHPVDAIEWAADQGITDGCDTARFCPDQPLKRKHARVFIERFYDQVLGADGNDQFANPDFTRADMMDLLHSMAPPTTNTTTTTSTTNTTISSTTDTETPPTTTDTTTPPTRGTETPPTTTDTTTPPTRDTETPPTTTDTTTPETTTTTTTPATTTTTTTTPPTTTTTRYRPDHECPEGQVPIYIYDLQGRLYQIVCA